MENRIHQLRAAREWSQADLAQRLGVSRQTVNALETGRSVPSLPVALRVAWVLGKPLEEIFVASQEEKMTVLQATWEYQDRIATAFDEVGILHEMGREGWELTSFGVAFLRFRRPEDAGLRHAWAYHRVDGVMLAGARTALETEGWVFCGSWMGVFHYFKRPAS